MSDSQSKKPVPVGLGAFALSHWELLALLRVLKIEAIPGQNDDAVPTADGQLTRSPKDIETPIQVALQDLAARGFVDVIPAQPGAKSQYTVAVPTPVLSQLVVCATGWYTLRILTMMDGERITSYLHERKQLGVVHSIDPHTASHLFIPVFRREGILLAVSQLTDSESTVMPSRGVVTLGTITAPLLQNIIREQSRGGVNRVTELLGTSGLVPGHQRNFADTLVRGDRFDEISFGYNSTKGPQQANALRLKYGDQEYFCFTEWYTDDSAAVYTVTQGGKGACARFVEPLLKIFDR